MPTSKDVAKRAGVSIATISRVYQSPELVKPETRNLVLKAAAELNYYPNLSARSLKQNKSNAIGIAVNDFTNPFFFQVIEKIHHRLEDTTYQLLTFSSSQKRDFYSNNKISRYLCSNQIDAFLFSPYYFEKKDRQLFMNSKQYFLQLYADFYDELDSIIVDDFYGTYLATKYLLEQGHQKILLLTTDSEINTLRGEGYCQAYHDFMLTPDPQYIRYHSIDQNNTEAIRSSILQLKPTAIISHCEVIIVSTLTALKSLNLNFPEDISFIAYDDYPWIKVMGITAISQPIELVGNVIADTVLQALSDMHSASTIKQKIKPELILRDSVKKFLST